MTTTKPDRQQPIIDLLSLYDDLSEFVAYCAFFCDAVAALSREEHMDTAAALGLRYFSEWLKERSIMLKDDLEAAWQAAAPLDHPRVGA